MHAETAGFKHPATSAPENCRLRLALRSMPASAPPILRAPHTDWVPTQGMYRYACGGLPRHHSCSSAVDQAYEWESAYNAISPYGGGRGGGSSSSDGLRPAFIVSSTATRFERASRVALRMGFQATRLPAILVNQSELLRRCPQATTVGPKRTTTLAYEGHRLAMRSAWRAVAQSGRPTAVFEDDIVPSAGCHAVDIDYHIRRSATAEIIYMGGGPAYLTAHAQWLTPRAAAWLLHRTATPCRYHAGSARRSLNPRPHPHPHPQPSPSLCRWRKRVDFCNVTQNT